ncbi:hypothetical protein TSUD_369560 [Trifolium subterraneum]|uniref:Myosin motor domain-containing protein n=1 Tax=Trifolium subterraneum TaxID=3900 RepID=A0A2Z6PSP8_TRISU|nr:hypothetical protein TSUD_369560 [Trifolium subterraneum]
MTINFVLHQLRSCGVLEAVRISRAGYPTRMNHQEFSRWYEFLLSGTDVPRDLLSTSVAVLQKFNIPSEMHQVGYTKLYLRAGLVPWRIREKSFCRELFGFKNASVVIKLVVISVNLRMERQYYNHVMPDLSKELVANMPSALQELQNRVYSAEAIVKQKEEENTELREKEEENTELREKVKQSERKRVEYEAKMKSMEEAWQKQMASLQIELTQGHVRGTMDVYVYWLDDH